MNPGIGEEVGQTTRTFIDALRTQPAVLALIIANFVLLGFFFYALKGAGEFRNTMIQQSFEYQREVSQLLSKCVVPK